MIYLLIFIGSLIIGCSTQSSLKSSPPLLQKPSATISPLAKRDIQRANQYRQLGLDYRRQGDLVKAIQLLEQSVALDPQNRGGKVILGWTYHLAKQEQKATQTLTDVLKNWPDEILALNALGIVYLVNGQLQKSVATHLKAAQLKPDNEIAYYNLSLAYQRLQDYERANIHARKAVALEPNNPHPWVALAMSNWCQENQAEAQKNYSRAIALDPRYRERWFLAHLETAGFSPEQIKIVEKIQK